MAQAVRHDYVPSAVIARPVSHTVAIVSIVFASIVTVLLIGRELAVGSRNAGFVSLLGCSSLIVAGTGLFAAKRQKEVSSPKWTNVFYLILIGLALTAPLFISWASELGLGQNPSLVPFLALFICVLAPFMTPNQAALGLGSAIPKILIVWGALHFTENTDLGIISANHLLSPQTAICAMAIFSAISSLGMMLVKSHLKMVVPLLIGALVTLPCILQIEAVLIAFHVL